MTFSSGLKGARSLSPMLWMAILSSSLSDTPVERCCLRRKYLPASMREFLGTRPTISVPVTRTPRAAAARHTSSNATWSGVCLMSVMFIETWATPYSGMNQPMAFVPLSVPGIIIVLPSASFSGFPTGEPPSRIGRPFSRTSYAMALARRVEVVLRLKFTAMRKSRAPTTVAPLRAACSVYLPGPKSGASFGSEIRFSSPSYSPLRHTARLRLSGRCAAAS